MEQDRTPEQDKTAERLSELIDRIDDLTVGLRGVKRAAEAAWTLYNDGEGEAGRDLAKLTSELSALIVELGALQVEATNISSSAVLDEMGGGPERAARPVRYNADGSAVCRHRDLSVCPACATDPRYVEVVGAFYFVPDETERAALRASLA